MKTNSNTRIAKRQKAARALARILIHQQALKSISLELERTGVHREGLPKFASEWADLREAFGIVGYPTEDDGERLIRAFLK